MDVKQKQVKVIKPTIGVISENRTRVAAYCRVSTDSLTNEFIWCTRSNITMTLSAIQTVWNWLIFMLMKGLPELVSISAMNFSA